MRARVLLGVVVLLACKPNDRKNCEHAREVMVARQRAAIESIIADENIAAGEAKAMREEVARMESDFVERCLGLDATGKACIARIDEIDAATGEMLAAIETCEREGRAESCFDHHVEKFDQRFAECSKATDPLFGGHAENSGDAEPGSDTPEGRTLARWLAAADEACACVDFACTQAVGRRLGDFVAAQETKRDQGKMSEATLRKIRAATKRMTECAMKAANDAAPK